LSKVSENALKEAIRRLKGLNSEKAVQMAPIVGKNGVDGAEGGTYALIYQ
jgi:hypothetical protein